MCQGFQWTSSGWFLLENNLKMAALSVIIVGVINVYLYQLIYPGQNGRHLADDVLACIFVNEKVCILIKISLKFVPKGLIDNNPALVFYTPVFRRDVLWYGAVRPSVRPSFRLLARKNIDANGGFFSNFVH